MTAQRTETAPRTETEQLFDALATGDRIEVEQTVTVGSESWTTTSTGKVVRTQRRRQGLHEQRNDDDHVFVDAIVLELPDGELTTLTIDPRTKLRRA